MSLPITLNGQPRDVAGPARTTLAEVVALTGASGGVAVAVNGAVVPRSGWDATRVEAGDVVEVVTAVQGG